MKPNILMIICDQLRYDSVGFAEKTKVRTPHIDALARSGAWCDNAFSATPTCCPARQEILSGKRCESFGALWNYDITSKIASLPKEQPTWTAAMHEAGYVMSHVGKWHVSDQFTPLDFGFDDYLPEGDYFAWRKTTGYPDPAFSWFGNVDEAPKEYGKPHYLARYAVSKMQEYAASGKPWHVRLDFSEPHLPCYPAREFADLYQPEEMVKWGSFDDAFIDKPYIQRQNIVSWGNENKTWEDWAQYVARYFAVITQVDDAIGQVLAALEETGQKDNTVILFTADHGDMAGSHRMIDKHYVLYDDTIHIPLIFAWPGHIPEGLRIKKFVNNSLDIAPTMTELTESRSFETDGVSLLHTLLTKDETPLKEDVVCTLNGQQFGLYTQRMIRTDKWKYIWNLTDVDELYDLEQDPWETENLIHHGNAEILRELRQRLFRVLEKEDPRLVKNQWIRRQLAEGHKL